MKKSIAFCIVILVLTFASSGICQIKIGAIGGANFSTVKIIETKDAPAKPSEHLNFGIGGVLDLPVYKNWSVQLEPMYIRKGANLRETGMTEEWLLTANYLEIPVLIKYNFGADRPYLLAGAAVSYLLNGELTVNYDDIDFSGDLKNVIEKYDYNLTFGGGLEIPVEIGDFFFEIRYSFGLPNFQNGGTIEMKGNGIVQGVDWEKERDGAKNQGLKLMAGWKIPIRL